MKAKTTSQKSFEPQDLDITLFLENKNIDICNDLRPLLHQAIKLGDEERVRTLLASKDIEIDRRDGFNETPLYIAVHTANINIVQLLIDAGANLNITNRLEDTALHIAAFTGNLPATEALLKAGAKVTVKNNWDQTPLHFATIIGNLHIAKLLLNAGADKNAINKSGKTPFQIAKQKDDVEFLELLSKPTLYSVSAEKELSDKLDNCSLQEDIKGLPLTGDESLIKSIEAELPC
jgi:ankyrin repeat protein